jgi:serine phosphatase RsbU (regulator of sigma subunit)
VRVRAGTAASGDDWARVLVDMVEAAHLAPGELLSAVVDDALARVGLTGELYLVDLAQRALTAVRPGPGEQLAVDTTAAGRCYQHGEILAGPGHGDQRVLWVPLLDGMDRVGVLRVGLGGDGPDPDDLHARLWTVAGLAAHVLMAKVVYSDRLRALRADGPLSSASELLWQLLPPRTFATDRVVVSAILEPHEDVAGDAYDYAVSAGALDLAVFDAAGHDLQAGLTTAMALSAVRGARRSGERDLARIAERADALLAGHPGPLRFATAVLARLDTGTGLLRLLVAGHPPPLLVRGGRVVGEVGGDPRPPLGIVGPGGPPEVAERQLEPGDHLLFYSDGIVEARDAGGRFFGDERLVELTEAAVAEGLSAPEALRRLCAAVLAHQDHRLQDDATLVLVEWSTAGHLRMLPARGRSLP